MGLRSQIGAVAEVSYGAGGTVDRFYEFVSETLDRRNRPIQSNAIRASGRNLRRGARRKVVGRDGAGDIRIEIGPDDVGLLFEHALGDVSSVQPGTTAWEHTFTLGSLAGKSLAIQKGVEQDDETVVPFTFVGCKIPSFELGVGVNEFAVATFSIDARDVDVAPSLAAASFTDGNLFCFADATLQLDDVVVAQVRNANVRLENKLDTERYFLGNQGLKAEPRDNDYPTVTGTMEADFVDRATFYDVYAADDPLKLELIFDNDVEIEAGLDEELRVTVAQIRLSGDTPKVDGPSIPTLRIPYEGFFDGATTPIEILLRNSDATP